MDRRNKTAQNTADMGADAVMPTYARADISFVRGEGSTLFTASGDAYLDFASGLAVNIFGHGDKRLNEALISQAQQLWHCSNLYHIPQQEKLASRLAGLAGLDQVFFCNSGAEANEAAVKMARRYHAYQNKGDQNKPSRHRIICATGAFHGRTLAMLAATDRPAFREGFYPLPEGFDHVPFGNLNELRASMSEDVAAIMVEPIQGEGGVVTAPEGYLKGLRQAADEFGALLIVDEIQSGMGRTGKLFAYQHSDIQPDLVVLAKGLGGGFPVGAVIARKQIGDTMGAGSHGSTFGGNPLAMAVANAVLDHLEEDGFFADLNRRMDLLFGHLDKLANSYPSCIKAVRGIGFLRGLQLADHLVAGDMVAALRDKQLLLVPASENVVRFLPALSVKDTDIDKACSLTEAYFKTKA